MVGEEDSTELRGDADGNNVSLVWYVHGPHENEKEGKCDPQGCQREHPVLDLLRRDPGRGRARAHALHVVVHAAHLTRHHPGKTLDGVFKFHVTTRRARELFGHVERL